MDPITRRAFVLLSAPAALARHPAFPSGMGAWEHPFEQLAREESGRIFRSARIYLGEEPRTIISTPANAVREGSATTFRKGIIGGPIRRIRKDLIFGATGNRIRITLWPIVNF